MESLTLVNHRYISVHEIQAMTLALRPTARSGAIVTSQFVCWNSENTAVFAREQFCSESNIIACFCYTKLYLENTVETFDSTTSATDLSTKELHTGTLRGC